MKQIHRIATSIRQTIPLLSLILFPLLATTLAARTAEDAVTPALPGRHNGFMKQIAKANGDIQFVLIGDSITDFWTGNKGKDSFVEFAPWKPLNLGVSGERTENVLWRLLNGELDGYKAKAVMIMIGTNNLGSAADEKPEWVAAGVKKIVEVVRQKQPQAKILLLAIFPRGATPQDEVAQRVTQTNKLLPALADGKSVFFMDIGAQFLDEKGNLKQELFPDYLHPNADGYNLWLQAVKPKLEELMKQGPDPL